MNRPRAILFDYGDTILKITRWEPQAGERAVYDLARNPRGVPYDEVAAFAERIVQTERDVKASGPAEFHIQGFWRLLYDRFGMTFDLSPLELEWAFWRTGVGHELTEGLTDLLDALSERGIVAAIVSNAVFSGEILERELRHYGIADRFAFTMSSADYNLTKPHELLYEAAMGRLNLPAEAIWFAGDRCETDVEGANRIGMTSVWYTGAVQRERTCEPALTAGDWREVIEAMDGATPAAAAPASRQ